MISSRFFFFTFVISAVFTTIVCPPLLGAFSCTQASGRLDFDTVEASFGGLLLKFLKSIEDHFHGQ